jgi:carbon-monoxide dehydrogenase large subunit
LSKGAGLIVGPYEIPHASLRAMAVFTNTMPTNAYRSSGRPEVTFAIERLLDTAAERLGIDRIELRRKNLIRPEAMPYLNAVGMTYDSGRYQENMDRAMEIADWKRFEQRRREAAKRGRLLGRGLANYVESSIGAPNEQARITVRPQRRVEVVIGTQPSGQGHETSFAQVISDLLRVPVESVTSPKRPPDTSFRRNSRTASPWSPTMRCTIRYSPTVAPSARSRSTRRPETCSSPATRRSMMSAVASIR